MTGTGSASPSRRAAFAAAASTSDESRPPEKLTRHGAALQRRSARLLERRSGAVAAGQRGQRRGRLAAVPEQDPGGQLECGQRGQGFRRTSSSKSPSGSPSIQAWARKSVGRCAHADHQGTRLPVGGQPALTYERALQAGGRHAAQHGVHAAVGRARKARRGSQLHVLEPARLQLPARAAHARAASTTRRAAPAGRAGVRSWPRGRTGVNPCGAGHGLAAARRRSSRRPSPPRR